MFVKKSPERFTKWRRLTLKVGGTKPLFEILHGKRHSIKRTVRICVSLTQCDKVPCALLLQVENIPLYCLAHVMMDHIPRLWARINLPSLKSLFTMYLKLKYNYRISSFPPMCSSLLSKINDLSFKFIHKHICICFPKYINIICTIHSMFPLLYNSTWFWITVGYSFMEKAISPTLGFTWLLVVICLVLGFHIGLWCAPYTCSSSGLYRQPCWWNFMDVASLKFLAVIDWFWQHLSGFFFIARRKGGV